MARIVIIEDNEQNARLAEKLLKKASHQVVIAQDGETGLAAVLEHTPDVILIDLGLPDIDGQTIISMLKHQEQLNAAIIAFTAWPEDTAQKIADAYA